MADEIGVMPSALHDEDRVKFKLLLRTAGRSPAIAEYIVSVNSPPYGGTCKVEPNTGKGKYVIMSEIYQCTTMWYDISRTGTCELFPIKNDM